MPILGINPENVPDLEPVPDGKYEVTILSMKNKDENGQPIVSKSERKMIKVALRINEHSDTSTPVFLQFLEIRNDDNETFKSIQSRQLKDFMLCFDLPLDIPSEDDLCEAAAGATGWVNLSLTSDPEYGDRNEVKRFLPAS